MTIFQISDELFWGFNVNIDINTFENNEMIIKYIKYDLILYLRAGNLQLLEEEVNKKKFHIHDDFQNLYKHEIVYVCTHEH